VSALRASTLVALLVCSGCGTLLPLRHDVYPVYSWKECYPIDNEMALRLSVYIDYCADPDWDGQHWGVVAYYAGSAPKEYLALAWGIWYRPHRPADLSHLQVMLRLDDGRSFLGALGARPQFTCRSGERGECSVVVVKLRGADGSEAERVFGPLAVGSAGTGH
jgi:hypothetical protein